MGGEARAWIGVALLLATASLALQSEIGHSTHPANHAEFTQNLVAAALDRTNHHVRYVSDYVAIPYPSGDVPPDTGVCTDEVIRIYRAVGIDLQKTVHEDMTLNFDVYRTGGSVVLTPTSTTAVFRT